MYSDVMAAEEVAQAEEPEDDVDEDDLADCMDYWKQN